MVLARGPQPVLGNIDGYVEKQEKKKVQGKKKQRNKELVIVFVRFLCFFSFCRAPFSRCLAPCRLETERFLISFVPPGIRIPKPHSIPGGPGTNSKSPGQSQQAPGNPSKIANPAEN
jgi:hypothetical protein